MRELPFELVVEILVRVPVKDLIRFRCVCKSWRSLFQDERFIERHMAHAPRKILWFPGSKAPVCHLSYENGNTDQAILQEIDLNIGDKILLLNSPVIGCCRGLFCLDHRDNTFGIWNPSRREFRRITTTHMENWAERGFGYDHSSQDYKLVYLIVDKEGRCCKAKVLSFKSGVSRMIEFPCLETFVMCHTRAPGTLVGENLYWQVLDNDMDVIEKILSFDLVTETFNYYPGPPHTRHLEVVRGGLCAIGTELGDLDDSLVIWSAQHEKENNGVVKSWTKILRLSWGIVDGLIGRSADDISWLVSVITHGDLLLFILGSGFGEETKMLAYNLEENSLRLVETSFSLDGFVELQTYIETLVPPLPCAL